MFWHLTPHSRPHKRLPHLAAARSSYIGQNVRREASCVPEGNVDRVDLTLLSIHEQKLPIYLQMRRMPLCENNPWPGEPVIVAIPEGTARSHIMLPALLPPNIRERFSTVISDVATTGNSGSGVFDAGQKCLLGIMSRKIYVPANTSGAGSEDKDIANVAPEGTCLMAAEDICWTATVAACLRSEVDRRSCTHVLRRF
jgi:hypothetical protein